MRRPSFCIVGLIAALASTGISLEQGSPDASGAIRLSAVMQRISAQPDYAQRVQSLLGGQGNKGFLTAGLMQDLRKLILGREWQRVDHFPSLTIGALNQSVKVAERAAGNPASSAREYAPDVGPYALGRNLTVDFNVRATKPTYDEDPDTAVKKLPYDLIMGDGPNPQLAPYHAESIRLAQVLNRLAQNPSDTGRGTLRVTVGKNAAIVTSDQLLQALSQEGESVTVDDARYFANFAHLHDRGQDVLAPFWIDTQIVVPEETVSGETASGQTRSLIVPVSHSEYELHIRGSKLNADVSFYFGIDGKAEFRTMDSQDQLWVMGGKAHTYTGEQAQTAIRMLSAALRVYQMAHVAHPDLAFGGYYTLGVCQDASAAVEQHMEGKTTLFPLTHDPAMFPAAATQAAADREFLKEFERLPTDRGNAAPEVSRVLGALPTADVDSIPIPELRADLALVTNPKHLAALQRTPNYRQRIIHWLVALTILLVLAVLLAWVIFRRAAKIKKAS